MAKRPRSSAKTQKRHGDSLSDDESPSKKHASNTTAIDLSTPSEISDPVFPNSTRNPKSEARLSMPYRSAEVQEDASDSGSSAERVNVKPERINRAGTIAPGLSVLGQHVTTLIGLITKLRDNGIERLDLDLPQIVVVGDQSTGKSSLIEGLSAIKVPRDEGTCTRCPIEINLKATEEAWHCHISIIKKYRYKASKNESNPSLGLGPYNAEILPARVEPFADVIDKNEIPIWLRRAQLAVLNPSKAVKTFAVPPHLAIETETTQESFSPNVIRLEIYAPNLPSLNFFDLPGVVVQDEDAESHVPEMIRKLVKSYIATSKSLVLLTLPIDSDRANSSAAGLVFDAKAGDRTIGIISKPDKLVNGNIQQWREILSGQKFKFNLGYRVVKNPADPSVSYTEARRQERDFFNTNPSFSGPLSIFQDRFGTERLSEFLSKHLVTMIKDCLPEIEEKVSDRVTKIGEELITLPKPPTNPVVYEIQNKLVDFVKQLKDITSNSMDFTACDSPFYYKEGVQWFQAWHKNAQMFFEVLMRSAPRLDTQTYQVRKVIDLESNKASEQQASITENLEKQALEKQALEKQISETISSHTSFSSRQRKEICATVIQSTKKFTLSQLRNHLHAFNGGVYGIGDPRVFERLLQESISHWNTVLKGFLEKSSRDYTKLIITLLNIRFKDLKNTELLRMILESARKYSEKLADDQLKISGRFLIVEHRRPLTLDHEQQETSKQSVMKELVEQLLKARVQKRVDDVEATSGKVVSEAEKRRITDQLKLEPTNPHYQELNELAGCIAYYKVAARRFADYNCLFVRNEFFQTIVENMMTIIGEELGFSDDVDIVALDEALKSKMVPSKKELQRRLELENELEVLEQTKRDVMNVLNSNEPGDSDGLYDSDHMET